jgi:hypothetical protein
VQRIQLRTPSGIAIVVIAAALLALAATATLAARTYAPAAPAAAPHGTAVVCQLNGPRLGLELNTVAVGSLFKTIAMEKELFNCGTAGAPTTQQRDVETFIELVEDLKGQLVQPPTVMLTNCVSAPAAGTVTCVNKNPPLNPANPTPLKGCQPNTFKTPDDPVAMNTAVSNGIAKTIKVDKSWYTCDTPQGVVIQDVYVFNEILEHRGTVAGSNTPTMTPFAHRTFGVVCSKVEARAVITGCAPFRTAPAAP